MFQIDSFLPDFSHDWLYQHTIARESEFVATQTATGAIDYRKSLVLYELEQVRSLFQSRLTDALPSVVRQLGMKPFSVVDVEMQLTAHGDGCYYRPHNDNGSPEVANRYLTYVYYFHGHEKRFSGGELKLGDHVIEPRDNSIVFFDSSLWHEVLPVVCPSAHFADFRFTVNGWLRSAEVFD